MGMDRCNNLFIFYLYETASLSSLQTCEMRGLTLLGSDQLEFYHN